MTAAEERSLLVSFVRQTWTGTKMPPMICAEPPGVPFSVSDLYEALCRIPVGKSVAAPCAPGAVWRSHAGLVAPILHDILTHWWGHNPPLIPNMWRTGWLQLIPKPSKPPTKPQNLRPLAMQCPLGKAVLGVLIRLAAQQSDHEFRKWPIWAFLASRSTQDPLRKVAAHCKATRDLIASQRPTPHTKAAACPRWSICGGLQVFVDLEKAFDSVNRCKLFAKLHLLDIHVGIIQLLQCWHVDTDYIVTHGGVSATVEVTKGLRQGCKGAPFLWNCLLVLLLLEMNQTYSLAWIRDHISIYADDCHIGGIFRSVEEFDFLLHAIGFLFQLLHEFDLQLNPSKSVALLAMHGSRSRSTKAKYVSRDPRGDKLKIPMRGQSDMLIPLQSQATYLGCIMSYHAFEDCTTWHRVKLAHIGFLRLRRWLCNQNHFTLKHRLSLWRTCIMPIMTYGVFAVGITDKGIKHMITQIGKMFRRIVGDPSHVSRHTNEQFSEHLTCRAWLPF